VADIEFLTAIPSHVEGTGIVTLADSRYFPGLELLCQSVRESFDVPVVCFDLGLDAAQLERARRKCPNLSIRPMPVTDDMASVRRVFENAGPLAKPGKRSGRFGRVHFSLRPVRFSACFGSTAMWWCCAT
jgi:hypothetical protein